VPVWLRLNKNRIADTASVLNTMEAEGVTFCAPRSAEGCWSGYCSKKKCPLLHLVQFKEQNVTAADKPLALAMSPSNGSAKPAERNGIKNMKKPRPTDKDQES